MDKDTIFVGLDVHKETIAVAVANGRPSDVRSWGVLHRWVLRHRSHVPPVAARLRQDADSFVGHIRMA